MTNSERLRDSSVMMSSAMPSEKYSCSGSPLMLVNASTAIEGLSGSGRASPVPCTSERSTDFGVVAAVIGPQHKRLDRPGDVLQIERAKLLEREIEPAVHMIAHRSRDADAARRTLGLKPRRHIHDVAVHVGAVCESRRRH